MSTSTPSNKWLSELTDPSPSAKHIAWAGELLFAGAREDDKQGRTIKFDIARTPEDVGKSNPFSVHTRRRAGHGGTRFTASLAFTDSAREWLDEVMLLGWSDGPKGQTVAFLLQSQDDKHPFMGIERGTSCMAVLIEIDDHDAVVDQIKRERVEKAPQKLSNVAAQMLKNPTYQLFMDASGVTETDAAMKLLLEIESKSQLDSDAEAVKRFRTHCSMFVDWQRDHGYLRG